MRSIATLADDLQQHRTEQLVESVGDIIDRRGPYMDTPGFGWLSARMGYFTQQHDRVEGRYAPVYDNEMDLRAIRMAGWLMDEEVPVAKAMKARLTDYTISTGFDWEITHDSPKIQSICRQIVKRFLDNADWGTVERESFQREIVDGEFIAEFVNDGSDISMEILEGDWLNEPANPRELEEYRGIEFPACWTFGVLTRINRTTPLAYHINRGGIYTDWDVVSAKEFVHWKRNVGRNPKRGFSDHYTTHKWLKYGDDVLSRTAQGTAIQASIAYIVEHAKGTTPRQAAAIASNRANVTVETNPATGQPVTKRRIAAGEVVDITNGSKYHASLLGSNASMIYIDVMEALFRLSGTVYAFPENFVTGYAGNNNMASSIEAKMPFVQGRYADQAVRANRLEILLLNVIRFGLKCLPRLGIAFEDIEPGLEITIAAPDIVQKDPAQLTAALVQQKEAGWISDRMAVQELGRDYDDVKKQIEEEGGAPGAAQGEQPQVDGSMSSLSRRQYSNNKKAIMEVVGELREGKIDQQQASVMLAALGLSSQLVDKLLGEKQEQLTEAKDGDGDGLVFDGTSQERAVTPEEKKASKSKRSPAASKSKKQATARVSERKMSPRTKAALAKASAKRVGKEIQDKAKANEYALAKALGGEALPNSAPHDVETDDAFVEVKTVVTGENAKLTMNKYAQVLKVRLEKQAKKPFHTVVYDDTKYAKTGNIKDRRLFYRRGVAGSARLSSLYLVEGGMSELKQLMATPERQLPEAAKRTDKRFFVGTWKPVKGTRGFKNSKTGELALPKK